MILALDIETTGGLDVFKDRIVLTSVVTSDNREYLIEGSEYPKWLLDAIADKDVLKLVHNASFDFKFIEHNFGIVAKNIWDTLAVERLLVAGNNMPCDLEAVTSRRLGKWLDKSIRGHFLLGQIGDVEREYCMNDSRVLYPIYDQQIMEIKRNGQLKAAELESSIGLVVADMELTGIGFDKDLWGKFVPIIRQKRADTEFSVLQSLDIPFSVNLFGEPSDMEVSLTQREKVLWYLKKMGIVLKDYRSDTLLEYVLTEQDPKKVDIVSKILKFKKWDKALSWSYLDDVNPSTGRIHPNFNAQGADTFRFSCSNPNMQQVTKPFEINFRHLFRSREGGKIVGADYSQIELRILADLTGEKDYVESFNGGLDLHEMVAAAVLHRPIKDKSERGLGKVINFGVVAFGGGVKALQGAGFDYGMLIPVADAERYIAAVRAKNVTIENWGRHVKAEMIKKGYVQTPIGHRRYLPGEERETVARNTNVQMFAGGIIKEGMVSLFTRLRKDCNNAHIMLQVHDELVLECEEDEAEKVKVIVEEEMIKAGESWLKKVPVCVDSYISNTWEKY